jgi:hypothetical protein
MFETTSGCDWRIRFSSALETVPSISSSASCWSSATTSRPRPSFGGGARPSPLPYVSLGISIERSNLNARCFARCTDRSPDSSTGSTVRDPDQAHLGPQGKPRTTVGTSRVVGARLGAATEAKGGRPAPRVVRLALWRVPAARVPQRWSPKRAGVPAPRSERRLDSCDRPPV